MPQDPQALVCCDQRLCVNPPFAAPFLERSPQHEFDDVKQSVCRLQVAPITGKMDRDDDVIGQPPLLSAARARSVKVGGIVVHL
jgi:hypothetical protein